MGLRMGMNFMGMGLQQMWMGLKLMGMGGNGETFVRMGWGWG